MNRLLGLICAVFSLVASTAFAEPMRFPPPNVVQGDFSVSAGRILFVNDPPNNISIGDSTTLPLLNVGTIQNIGIGGGALGSLTTEDQSIAIGYQAGLLELSGRTNVYVGTYAGKTASACNSCTFLGAYAGIGGYQYFPGTFAQVTGVGDTCIGEASCLWLTGAASYNTAVGLNSLFSQTTTSFNTCYGNSCGYSVTASTQGVFVGAGSYQFGDGSDTVAVGYLAGSGVAVTLTTNAQTVQGGTTFFFADTSALSTGMVISGGSLPPGTTVSSINPNVSVTLSAAAVQTLPSGSPIVFINNQHTGTQLTAVGWSAARSISGSATGVTAIGSQALIAATTGGGNTAVGQSAGITVTTGANGTFVGQLSGRFVSTGNNNTAVGAQALAGATGVPTTGAGNTGVGYQAGLLVQGASHNNSLSGFQSAVALTTGSNNVCIGSTSCGTLTTGSGNIVIGQARDVVAAGSANTLNIGDVLTATGINAASTSTTTVGGSLAITTAAAATSADTNVCITSGNVISKGSACTQIPQVVFASLPSASGNTNLLQQVTDVGIGGSLWVSDGTNWQPVQAITLCRSNAAVSTTSATEVQMQTCTIPANLMGLSRKLALDSLWSYTASVNAKSLRARFAAACGITGASYMNNAPGATSVSSRLTNQIMNRGVANSQVGSPSQMFGGVGASAVGVMTGVIDTTASTCVAFTGSVAAGETLTLESYEVRLLP